MIAEDGCSGAPLHGGFKQIPHALPEENIVSEHKADVAAPDKVFRQQKGLCQSFGTFLYDVFETATPLGAVTKQFPV